MKRLFLLLILATSLFYSCDELGFSNLIPEPDKTPPSVSSSNPAAGSSDFDPREPVRVYFQEDLDTATTTSTNITLTETSSGTAIACDISFIASENNLLIRPQSDLAYETDYSLTLGTGLTDKSGNALETEYTLAFKTSPFNVTVSEDAHAVLTSYPVFEFAGNADTITIDSVDLNGSDITGITSGEYITDAHGVHSGLNTLTVTASSGGNRTTTVQQFFYDDYNTLVFEDSFDNGLADWQSNPDGTQENDFITSNGRLINYGPPTGSDTNYVMSIIYRNYTVDPSFRYLHKMTITEINPDYDSFQAVSYFYSASDGTGVVAQAIGAISPVGIDAETGKAIWQPQFAAFYDGTSPDDPTTVLLPDDITAQFLWDFDTDGSIEFLFEKNRDDYTIVVFNGETNEIIATAGPETIDILGDFNQTVVVQETQYTPEDVISFQMDYISLEFNN